MNEKQQIQSEIAKLVKQIQFERNRPSLTVPQLQKLKEQLLEVLASLKSED